MKMQLRGTWKKTSNQNPTSTGEIELIPEKPNIGKNSFVQEINSHWILIKGNSLLWFILPWKSQSRFVGISRRDGFKIITNIFLKKSRASHCILDHSPTLYLRHLTPLAKSFYISAGYSPYNAWIKMPSQKAWKSNIGKTSTMINVFTTTGGYST